MGATSRLVALVAVLALTALGGCSRSPEATAAEDVSPPFRAHYADLVLDVPVREDLYQARNSGWGLSVKVCDRHTLPGTPPLCETLTGPVVNAFGLLTFVTAPRPGARFELLKERPADAPEPPAAPLEPIAADRIDKNIGGGGEAYQLSRLSVLDPKAALSTTTNGWPLARCATRLQGQRYCTIGFLIRGAFVETHVFAEDGVALDQKQVWDVASALDAKLRGLSPPAPR